MGQAGGRSVRRQTRRRGLNERQRAVAALGSVRSATGWCAVRTRRERPRRRRRERAAERPRCLRAARRSREHLGRSDRGDHGVDARGPRAVLRAWERQAVPASAVLFVAARRAGVVDAINEYCLRLADDRLILGHRLSEWCGHAPILEEDIALANIALDLIGQANLFYGLVGDPDQLAYFRDAIEYRNALIVELPKGDFAFTIIRQLLFSVAALYEMDALSTNTNADLAGIAAKAAKETRYHVRH